MTRHLPFRSMSTLLIQRIVLLALLCMVLLGVVQAAWEYRQAQQRFDKQVRVLADNSLRLLSTALWDIEPVAVQRQVDWLMHIAEIGYVRVRTVTGPVFEAGATGYSGQTPTVVLPIKAAETDSVLGQLEIWANTDHFGAQVLERLARMLGGYVLFTVLVCAVVAGLLRRELRDPLNQMARFAAEIKPATLSKPLILHRRNHRRIDEIDLVARGFRRLQADVQRHIRLLDQRVAERTQQLEELVEEVKRLSLVDSLTGCYNRRALDERLPAEIERSRRHGRPLSVVFIDLDYFKRINDELGHAAGDIVLCEVANRCRGALRSSADWMARYGGEEFVIVLPESLEIEATHFAYRLRSITRSTPVPIDERELSVTACFGVAQLAADETMEQLMARADALLYQAKQEGRDRVLPRMLVA
jgi:two-component system cell cycle response regulator